MPEDPTPPEGGNDPKPQDPPEPKTFTQEDLDRVVQERLARDRKDRPSEEQLQQWQTAAEKLAELEEQSQTDLEKAQKRAEKAEQERQSALDRASKTLKRAAITAEAAKQGAVDPDAVLALLPADAVTIGDDDQVTGAEKAVKDLLEAKSYLVGQATPPPPGDGGARTPVPPKDLDAQIREAEEKGDTRESIRLKSLKLAQVRAPA